MTSTTKRGFHLPWGGDDRTSEEAPKPAPPAPAPAAALPTEAAPPPARAETPARTIARRAAAEDLGLGPFGLAPTPEAAVDGEAPSDDPLVDSEAVARRLPDRPISADAAPAPDDAAPAAAEGAEAPAAPAPGLAWPDVDRAGSATHLASDVAPPPVRPRLVVTGDGPASSSASRRDNPLVVGLVKAMRDAARATRLETTARMRASATARMDEIRASAGGEAAAIRKRAEEDITGIREWSKAETARIKRETEQRIAGRRAQLAREAQTHTSEIERAVDQVKAAAAAFETDMERFFEMLLAEEDPARLATLAEQVPDAPVFAKITGSTVAGRASRTRRSSDPSRPARPRKTSAPRAPRSGDEPAAEAAIGAEAVPAAEPTDDEASPDASALNASVPDAMAVNGAAPGTSAVDGPDAARLAPDAAAAAEAEAIAGLDLAPGNGAGWPSGSLAAVLATAPRIDSPDDLSPEEIANLLSVEPEPETEPESETEPETEPDAQPEPVTAAEAREPVTALEPEPEPVDQHTRLDVTGLVTVAGISALRASLARLPGVASVSVTSGSNDDIVFAVVHSAAIDLRRAVAAFPGFNAQMTVDDGEVVGFAVTEPGAA